MEVVNTLFIISSLAIVFSELSLDGFSQNHKHVKSEG